MTVLNTITPQAAAALLKDGGVLVDIRAADEHARERIPGAKHQVLANLQAGAAGVGARYVIFHCRSGARTLANAGRLAESAGCEAFILEGGLDAWKQAGLPVTVDRGQPLELMRQVQIVAGSMALAGAILGALVNPWFHALSAFVGAGLVVAGLTGWCGMAILLRHMPWNAALRA